MDEYFTGDVVPIFFTTNAAAGAAVAPSSAFEAADVKLYKNTSATERSTTSGWTMTSPFDSITGLHLLAINLGDNTDVGFYEAGAIYTAVLSCDETVDSQTPITAVIGQFRIVPWQSAYITDSTADAVWDDPLAGHTTDSTAGWYLTRAGATGDPLGVTVPGAYGAGTAGYAIGHITDEVWDEPLAGHLTDSTAGWYLANSAQAGDAMDLVTDAVDAAAFATSAITELVAGILAGTVTAPTAAPTAPYTVDDVLGWLLAIAKFHRTQTATTETVYRDDGTTAAATAAKTDNGTTFTRGEFS